MVQELPGGVLLSTELADDGVGDGVGVERPGAGRGGRGRGGHRTRGRLRGGGEGGGRVHGRRGRRGGVEMVRRGRGRRRGRDVDGALGGCEELARGRLRGGGERGVRRGRAASAAVVGERAVASRRRHAGAPPKAGAPPPFPAGVRSSSASVSAEECLFSRGGRDRSDRTRSDGCPPPTRVSTARSDGRGEPRQSRRARADDARDLARCGRRRRVDQWRTPEVQKSRYVTCGRSTRSQRRSAQPRATCVVSSAEARCPGPDATRGRAPRR